MATTKVFARQTGYDTTGDDGGDALWWGTEAYAIRWGVVAAIFVLFLIFFVGGHLHAKQRMKKGKAPMAYHRWIVPRSQRARFETPSQNPSTFYQPPDGYPMQPYVAPPPAYDHESDYVPAYTPPAGATKVKADQAWEPQPPAGPPPAHLESGPSQLHR